MALACAATFGTILAALHLQRPDVSPLKQGISHYGNGPYRWLLPVANGVLGVGGLALVLGLASRVAPAGRSVAGLALLGVLVAGWHAPRPSSAGSEPGPAAAPAAAWRPPARPEFRADCQQHKETNPPCCDRPPPTPAARSAPPAVPSWPRPPAALAVLARAPGAALVPARAPAPPRVPTGALTESALAEMADYVAGALERFGVPGASVAVVQGGALRFARGFGVTELGGGGRPVGPDTRFIIGSVPKSMTALLVATLVDEGRLGWDTPVVEALPQFTLADPAATAAVTFRDLLSMRSGLPRFDGPLFFRPLTPEEVIESLGEVPLSAPPGEVFGYTNQGYATAGFAAAAPPGRPTGATCTPPTPV